MINPATNIGQMKQGQDMKTDVVIVAAGRGLRFGGEIPKQYQLLAGQPVLRHTLQKFTEHPDVRELIVVIAESDIDLFAKSFPDNPPTMVIGGATRSQSVYAGLQALDKISCGNVLIHDGARPFVSPEDISAITAKLNEVKACAPALPVVDAIKEVDQASGEVIKDAERQRFLRIQTPQGFNYNAIMHAFAARDRHVSYVDDFSIALQAGISCKTIMGNEDNFKITTLNDLQRAEQMIQQKASVSVTGTGYDVHQISPGDTMVLCGVVFECGFSLKGHSDADVGLHAITDGILGAMALGDIGDHFPPSEVKWKNADSSVFLRHAAELAQNHGAQIVHVDVTLICEQPKINPFRKQMRARIADILLLDITQVSVKATTTEKLGFAGRKEGIAALASVTVLKGL